MRKKETIILSALLVFFMSVPGAVLAYNIMNADELKVRIETKEPPTILLDIQKQNAYKEHHFFGSVRTFAYPAKTDLELESVVQGVRMHEQTGNEIVIIGPRGGRASKRTFDFLVTRGVPENKIFILEGGIRDWPYKEMLLDIKGGCK